jgi:hypothetical protein
MFGWIKRRRAYHLGQQAGTAIVGEISIGEHPHYRVAALGFRGIPVGVDARKVVETHTLPIIDIMMVNRKPGIGLAGMGTVSPPMQCFEAAVKALDAGR